MKIASIVSTKGGPGKTTVTANLDAFCADAHLKTLLLDLVPSPCCPRSIVEEGWIWEH
jgi:chromosome partitioning related protein ParA